VTDRHPRRLACLVLAALALSCGGGAPESEPPEHAGEDGAEPDESARVDPPGDTEPLPRDEVKLYYPSASGNGLAAEPHEIFTTASPGDRVKQIVADLIGGPQSADHLRALPPGTRLRQAWVLEDGVAFLDFSSELSALGGGSTNELLTVYSIVNSVVANVPEVERVGILIDGRTVESLNGHLDLRRPLAPDWSLVLGERTAERQPARSVRAG
jgi:spore germination protein GerM